MIKARTDLTSLSRQATARALCQRLQLAADGQRTKWHNEQRSEPFWISHSSYDSVSGRIWGGAAGRKRTRVMRRIDWLDMTSGVERGAAEGEEVLSASWRAWAWRELISWKPAVLVCVLSV